MEKERGKYRAKQHEVKKCERADRKEGSKEGRKAGRKEGREGRMVGGGGEGCDV